MYKNHVVFRAFDTKRYSHHIKSMVEIREYIRKTDFLITCQYAQQYFGKRLGFLKDRQPVKLDVFRHRILGAFDPLRAARIK